MAETNKASNKAAAKRAIKKTKAKKTPTAVSHKSLVSIIMGSDSDWPVLSKAADALEQCGVSYEVQVVSAHRTPLDMVSYAQEVQQRGIKVIIAGAGGAAHLSGMVASLTTLPVIGVPVALAKLDGLDSLLSIVQMPAGIPVATVAIDGAFNAGLLAVRILALNDPLLDTALKDYQLLLEDQIVQKNSAVQKALINKQQ